MAGRLTQTTPMLVSTEVQIVPGVFAPVICMRIMFKEELGVRVGGFTEWIWFVCGCEDGHSDDADHGDTIFVSFNLFISNLHSKIITYNAPTANTAIRASRSLTGRRRPQRTGTGSANRSTSVARFVPAIARKKTRLSTHFPGMGLFQNFCIGWHINKLLTKPPTNQEKSIAPITRRATRMRWSPPNNRQ